ncbi:MAG TPA: Tex-like N-terminal domain-containing protein, partial [Bacillota bacterium]|nr:Tex-like N-terminal domain-containing protein [Bacillota bacterium]
MDLIKQIARESKLPEKYLTAALQLLDEGNTVPFISRYRKEVTGEMDENQLRFLEERMAYLRNLEKRKQDVIVSIDGQGKLTSELSEKINKATILQEVEDLYLPFRPKRRTRASIAKEKGLEPLANLLLQQIFTTESLQIAAEGFITEDGSVEDSAAALAGAQDILAERVAEDADLRTWVRNYTFNQAILKSQAVDAEKISDFIGYYDYEEPVLRLPPHRVLALNRGETEGFLKLKLVTPREYIINRLQLSYQAPNGSAAAELVAAVATDGYDRLMTPSIERDIRTALTEKAQIHAIESFAENMRNLLLQPTVRNRIVMGVDPAFRT